MAKEHINSQDWVNDKEPSWVNSNSARYAEEIATNLRRVVVTGMGVVSSIGNNKQEVLDSLKNGKSGIEHNQEYEDFGFRSTIAGSLKIDVKEYIDRKVIRFMWDAAAYAYIAMKEAIADSGMEDTDVSNDRTWIVVGSWGASPENIVLVADTLRNRSAKKVWPLMVPRTMCSTVAACLATPFKIKGVNYSISSACATSAHCIWHGMELIQMWKQDVVFAGGGEELHWSLSVMFDSMWALSSKFNDTPTKASRAYDVDRDGFVISWWWGLLVLEELEHAKRRDAKIYAEVVGYWATSDGYDMVKPSTEWAVRCMRMAMKDTNTDVDYINTHWTSTPLGDLNELKAIREVFGEKMPKISSTKSLTGHALGAAWVNEAIYSILMMENQFVAASVNIEKLDPEAEGMPIVQKTINDIKLNTVMSNSFGFGGTNASLLLKKYTWYTKRLLNSEIKTL